MILHKDNSLDTHGPSRTIIRPRGKGGLPGSSPGGKPAGSPPTGVTRRQAHATPAVRTVTLPWVVYLIS